MRFWKSLLLVVFLFQKLQVIAQASGNLTPAIKAEVIDNLSSALLQNYVYPDTARRMNNFIQLRLKEGAYNKINSPIDFATVLSKDLRSVYDDLHLALIYNAVPENGSKSESYIATTAKRLQFEKQQNYGVPKAEILPGNIGYITINRFFSLGDQSIETMNSVFSFLKNSDGLIIDLRNNSGGDATMVNYICSYFFSEKTHINDMYEPRANKIYQYWTTPVSYSAIFPFLSLINSNCQLLNANIFCSKGISTSL